MDRDSFDPFQTLYFIFSLAAIYFGFVMAFAPGRALVLQTASALWPQAQGQVVSSHVESARPSRAVPDRREHTPRIWFSYQVGDRQYYSGSYYLYQVYDRTQTEAQAVVAANPPGASVNVRYFPSDPSVAFVENSSLGVLDTVKMGAGVFLMMAAYLVLSETIFRRKKT